MAKLCSHVVIQHVKFRSLTRRSRNRETWQRSSRSNRGVRAKVE